METENLKFIIDSGHFRGCHVISMPDDRHNGYGGKLVRKQVKSSPDKGGNIAIVPYFFLNDRNEKVFICNLTILSGNDTENRTARRDMAKILLSLRKHHFLYYTGKGTHDDMEEFMDYIGKKGYTLLANGTFFQYPVNRKSVTFIGNVKETGKEFIYRIYSRKLFLHLLHRLKAVKREAVRTSNPESNVS